MSYFPTQTDKLKELKTPSDNINKMSVGYYPQAVLGTHTFSAGKD